MAEAKRSNTNWGWMATALVFAILIIDQIIKIWVKTHMSLGEAIHVTDWFYIEFIENNGMAYGMTFINKLVLSLFRMVAIGFISIFLYKVIRSGRSLGYITCLSMVLAGSTGISGRNSPSGVSRRICWKTGRPTGCSRTVTRRMCSSSLHRALPGLSRMYSRSVSRT